MIAIRGMSWMLWQRNRAMAVGAGGYMLLFGAVLGLLGGKPIPVTIGILSMLLLCFAFLCVLGIFIYQDADVGSAGSSYPAHLFTLPVRTGHLVLLPMLIGSLFVFSSTWLITAAARHSNVAIDAWWPATCATTILALLQAIFWNPTGFPYSKLFLTILALPGIIIGMQVATALKISEPVICMYLTSITVASYAAAYHGVSKARRGDLPLSAKLVREGPRRAVRFKPAFSSAFLSQTWYEWRLHGLVLPVISGVMFLLVCVPLFWNNTFSPIRNMGLEKAAQMPTFPTMVLVYYPSLFALIPFAAWVVGCGARRSDIKRGSGSLHLFYATRPQSDWNLVLAKVTGALKSTLVTWAIILTASLPLLFMRTGIQTNDFLIQAADRPIISGIWRFVDMDAFLHILAFLAVAVLLTFRNYVLGFWTEFSGKLWLRHGYPVCTGLAALTVIFASSLTPPNISREIYTFQNINIALWTLFAVKLSLAGLLIHNQLLKGKVGVGGLVKGGCVYLGGATLALTLTLYLTGTIRRGIAEAGVAGFEVATSVIVPLTLLLIPVVRILAAPMTLSANRHSMRS